MKITRNELKELVRETIIEENEYQKFFKKALEKTGKSIPEMSDEEKKKFFNKIDAAWKSKGEKKESISESRKIKQFDDARSKSKNIAGLVVKIQGKTVVLQTVKGLIKTTMDDLELMPESVNEASPKKGRKSFYTKDNVGSSKYTINYYDGKDTHKDGSPFYGIKTFKNKKKYEKAISDLKSQGYIEESVNESTRRSTDFFEDSKHGKNIYKLLGGKKFKASKVKDYLDNLLDKHGDVKGIRIWDFIGKKVGLDVRKYDTKPVREYEFVLMGAIEDLYNTHREKSENISEESVSESFNIKKVLRKMGWSGETWTPKEFASQIKKLDDDTLKNWASSKKGIPNTPLAFQQKLVGIEMKKRGL